MTASRQIRKWARHSIATITALGLLTHCAHPPPSSTPPTQSAQAPIPITETQRAPKTPPGKGAERLQPSVRTADPHDAPPVASTVLTPIEPVAGRVTSFNAQAQFIIVDFSFNALPTAGQSLEVFREGRRIGSARCSRWFQAGYAVADLIEGEAQPGDEVRAQTELPEIGTRP